MVDLISEIPVDLEPNDVSEPATILFRMRHMDRSAQGEGIFVIYLKGHTQETDRLDDACNNGIARVRQPVRKALRPICIVATRATTGR